MVGGGEGAPLPLPPHPLDLTLFKPIPVCIYTYKNVKCVTHTLHTAIGFVYTYMYMGACVLLPL